MRARTPSDKTLFRTHLSAIDFSQAVRFIEAAQKVAHTSDEWWGLMLAAIVCYARPFSPNERRRSAAADSRLEIDARMLRTILENASDRKLHRRLLRLRNKAVAHSESRYADLRIIRATWPGDPSSLASSVALISAHWHPFNAQIDLIAFRRIAKALQTYCQLGQFALGEAIARERKRLRTK